MAMVGGLDLHRQQITFDVVEVESGQEWRGRIWQPDRDRFRRWLGHEVTSRAQGGRVALAVEGCTGWRYVAEEIAAAGFEAHLAEPADTQAARGRKRRAKTDRTDARLLRDLLLAGDLPESWIPPTDVLEWRERVRLYVSLVNQRTVWCQRIHAELYQHGVAVPEGAIRTAKTRAMLADDRLRLSPAARQRVTVGYRMIDADRHRGLATQTRPDPLRDEATGVSGVGQRPIRHRWTDRGCGVDRARRLPSFLPLRTSRAPHRPGRHGRCLGPAPRGRIPLTPRTRNIALGALRSSEELLTSTQSRSRLLHPTQGPSRRQDRGDLHGPQTRAALLSRAAQRRPRSRVRDAQLITARTGSGGRHRPSRHQGHPRSAPATGVPASVRAGRPSNTDATALPTNGGTPDHDCCRRRRHVRRAPR